ncbi:MAG: thiamine phosphate synthase [Candidatus Methanomethylophilaceae archaeon]
MPYTLYVVTDDRLSNGLSHIEVAKAALEGGADVVQLRVKDRDDDFFLKTARAISDISRHYDSLFIVNDRIDIALASDANGVHLGQTDIPVKVARGIATNDFIIGASVNNVKEALLAEKEGADYVALSPVFDTTSKDNAGSGHGLKEMRRIKDEISIPALAIGGINKHNALSVFDAGADGIAVISAVVSQPDITMATRELKALIGHR